MQRRATKTTRGPNAAEKRHLAWIKGREVCAATGAPGPVIGHHCEGSCFKHNKVLIGHWFVLGLSEFADAAVTRGGRRQFRWQYGPQSGLWLRQLEDYPHRDEVPDEVVEAIRSWGR
ncbi:hypothetical protein [uncultured Gilvimarinus sp.]|uniref:hypothetical protein n=1 Tax=uncultured Gilvimarinus sp. TaxID=1689143 RepID=UPI0030EEE6BB|tara:strand:+ start:579 stop:929 length:351 start_codon:yes stop_codon:yes gene_type:complete